MMHEHRSAGRRRGEARRTALVAAAGALLLGAACGDPTAGEPPPRFEARVSNLVNTVYTGESYLARDGSMHSDLLSFRGGDAFAWVGGGAELLTVGTHDLGDHHGYVRYRGHGYDFRWSTEGTLTIEERRGTWVRGTLEFLAIADIPVEGTYRVDTAEVRITFVAAEPPPTQVEPAR